MLNYVNLTLKNLKILGSLALLAGGSTLFILPSNAAADEKLDKICAKADARYDELFADTLIPEGTVVVKLYKYTFCPPNLEVPKGTKVQFVNVDKRTSHSVWFKDKGDEESERFFPEESVELFFDEVGTFNYLCGPHWESDNMRGILKITP